MRCRAEHRTKQGLSRSAILSVRKVRKKRYLTDDGLVRVCDRKALPMPRTRHTIFGQRAPTSGDSCDAVRARWRCSVLRSDACLMPAVFLCAWSVCGCAQRHDAHFLLPPSPVTVVVAPVLNLSNSRDWDPLKVTDWVASELQQFPGVTVIPVNRAAAVLAQAG